MLKITKGVVKKAQKCVIYGPEGIGKSTFAAQFPEPLFIDTEGSTNHMDVMRLPKPSSWTMLLASVTDVKNSPGCCKTLVIDTMDWAEQLCVAHVCATYQKKGIEDFGWGKGYAFVKEETGRFLNLLSDVIELGINVVITAHAQVRKFELPDECGSYDRYELKLGNKTSGQTSALVKEWADMRIKMKDLEHVGDELTHQIVDRLNRTFVTPIEREDILHLAHALDDVVDCLDGVCERLVLYKVTEVMPLAAQLSHLVVLGSQELVPLIAALRNMSNTAAINSQIQACMELENQADAVFHQALAEIFDHPQDPYELIKWKEILALLEDATDRIELVSKVVSSTVMRNA